MRVIDALAKQNLPRAECEILLAWALQCDRTTFFREPERPLTTEEFTKYSKALERRRTGEPVSYITGEKEFYGRVFHTDARALIPRPSTEGVVKAALEFLKNRSVSREIVDEDIEVISEKIGNSDEQIGLIIDIGTGSGCIAVTLACETPTEMKIIATDVSSEALSLAEENSRLHSVFNKMRFIQGSLLDPILDITEPFLLVANPPYIPSGNVLIKDVVDFEPHVALFGGISGADLALKIWNDAHAHPFCRGIVMECMTDQIPNSPK